MNSRHCILQNFFCRVNKNRHFSSHFSSLLYRFLVNLNLTAYLLYNSWAIDNRDWNACVSCCNTPSVRLSPFTTLPYHGHLGIVSCLPVWNDHWRIPSPGYPWFHSARMTTRPYLPEAVVLSRHGQYRLTFAFSKSGAWLLCLLRLLLSSHVSGCWIYHTSHCLYLSLCGLSLRLHRLYGGRVIPFSVRSGTHRCLVNHRRGGVYPRPRPLHRPHTEVGWD